MIPASVTEMIIRSKFTTWFYALLCLTIFLRAMFYLAHKLYVTGSVDAYDLAAIPIGLVSLYLSYMFFRDIVNRPRKDDS